MTTFRTVYSPSSEEELLVLQSELEGAGVRYLIQGDQFATAYPGAPIGNFNRRYIQIWEEDLEKAQPIFERLNQSKPAPPEKAKFGFFRRLFSWLVLYPIPPRRS